jgi:hypothetical protein
MPAMNRRRWSDLGRRERLVIIVFAAVQLTLLFAALRDIRRRPAEQIRGGKGRWVAISMINTVGPITYFIAGRRPG